MTYEKPQTGENRAAHSRAEISFTTGQLYAKLFLVVFPSSNGFYSITCSGGFYFLASCTWMTVHDFPAGSMAKELDKLISCVRGIALVNPGMWLSDLHSQFTSHACPHNPGLPLTTLLQAYPFHSKTCLPGPCYCRRGGALKSIVHVLLLVEIFAHSSRKFLKPMPVYIRTAHVCCE